MTTLWRIASLFSMFTLLVVSYQEPEPSAELRFCLSQPSTSSTLESFWHDASENCEMDPKRLLGLLQQLSEHSDPNVQMRCTSLFIHQIRKKLIAVASQQLEEALITQTLNANTELKVLLEQILEADRLILEAVWQRTFDEIYLLTEKETLIEGLISLKHEEIRFIALQALFIKSMARLQDNRIILPTLTYALTNLFNSNTLPTETMRTLKHLYQQMPAELRLLYSQTGKDSDIGLLNLHYWEYLYAPRDNGPDDERRIPLSWSKEKNSTDSDGHFQVYFNNVGSISITSLFGSSRKVLYADVDHKAPFFWIGLGDKPKLQWWRIIWPHTWAMGKAMDEHAIAFKNKATGQFLCATLSYDENRRYITLETESDITSRPDCQWFVKKLNQFDVSEL